MESTVTLQEVWTERKSMMSEADKLSIESHKLHLNAEKLKVDAERLKLAGDTLEEKANSFYKLGNTNLFSIIVKEFGNLKLKWVGQQLHLENGIILE